MTIVNKIIHRFVRPRYEYMNPDGELFSQIIPVNTQAYSYEKIPGANPNLPDSYIIRYVLGTGGSTYAQIANGQGKDKDGNIIPELSKEFVIRSDPQLIALITKLIKEQVIFSSYLTSDIDNNPFATKEALDIAEAWYVNGESVTPKLNDYVIVLSDESRSTGSGENPTTRYVCVDIVEDRPVWAFQYEVNNSNFTPEQWAAINSGVNTEKVELYDSYEDQIAVLLDHIVNKENPHEVTAEQIGLGNVDNTSDLDKPISTATQTALDNITSTLESHIENDNVHVTAEEKETWNSKQDALKMGNHIEIKNDVITVLDDLSTYDNRTSRFVSKDSDDLDNYYTKEELDKYLVGGNYKYNGEVTTYADLPHPLVPFGDDYYSLIWITANRLQYIDTGYHCNQDTEVYLKVKLNRGDNYLYSTIMNEPYKVGLAVNYGANTGVAYFGNQEIEVSIEDLKDTETEIILNRNGLFFDGIQVGWFDETEDFTTESTLFVPKWNSPDTHSMNLNVYAFRISQRNIFVRDYYPAISKEDESLVGLYDKVDNSFHVSDGEFPFVPGDYTSSVLGGTVYKVLDENRFYMWYRNDWIDVAELHTAGIGISIDKDGTINNTFDVLVDGESVVENAVADLTKHFDKKVDKTDEAFKIYGTDEDGNQVVYDKEDFGKVDDVQLNGTSVVVDKIANILVDSEVTEDSQNLITSGGVYNAIEEATPLYTAEEPATVDVGGFSKGDKPENMSFQDFADTLLHKYVDPSITNSISPNKTKYQIGETVDVTMTATITRNAPSKYPFTALAFYSENIEKKKITDGIDVKTGSWSYKFTGVGTTSKTKYYIENLKATATDTVKSVSTGANIVFVAPTFYGKISVPTEIEEAGQTGQYIQDNIETIISNCTRGLEIGNVTYNCNLSVEHYIFITPFTVTEIKDTVTSFQYLDSTSSFNYSRTEKGVTTAYKVYYLTRQATGNGYKFLFTVSVSEG